MRNTFGHLYTLTTFGESHGAGIGGVVDGMPAGIAVDMDFIQSEPVSESVKEAKYRLVFMSEDGERISNENIYVADSREPDSSKRIFRLRFNFKNQKYDKDKMYYLVVTDDNTGVELFRHPVIMDITFADDFGF